MILYMQSFLIVVLEVMSGKLFFEIFGEKRDSDKKIINHGCFIILMIGTYLLSILFHDHFALKEISIILFTTLIILIVYRMNRLKAFIISALFQGLILAVDYITLLTALYLFDSTSDIDNSYFLAGVLIVVLAKIVLFLIVLVIKRFMGNGLPDILPDEEWIRFLCFPLFSICVIIAMMVTTGDVSNQRAESVLFVVAFGIAGMNFVVFYLIHDILVRERKIRESEILKLQVNNQTDMYYSISENLDRQRKITHEYKNQLLCIDSLLFSEQYSELKTYVEKLTGMTEQKMDAISTNHVIADAILNTKYKEALEKDILFIMKINDLSDIFISDEDLVILLSNLLNNAMEACEKCKDNKVIKMKFLKEEDEIVLSVKNTYQGERKVENGTYLTTKEDKSEHGIGIKNIIKVVEKYNGTYVIKDADNEFSFSIIFPDKKLQPEN